MTIIIIIRMLKDFRDCQNFKSASKSKAKSKSMISGLGKADKKELKKMLLNYLMKMNKPHTSKKSGKGTFKVKKVRPVPDQERTQAQLEELMSP